VEETRHLVEYIADNGAAIAAPAGDAQDLERRFCLGDGPSTSLSVLEAPDWRAATVLQVTVPSTTRPFAPPTCLAALKARTSYAS
jgi:hypothetical protein